MRPESGYLTISSWKEEDIRENQNSMETNENLAALEPDEDYQVTSYEETDGESISLSLEYKV